MDRRLWTTQEDQHIVRLVAKFGTKKWPLISERLCAQTQFERTGKQCRQRWYNHLSPDISSAQWSQEDQQRLFEAHKEHGNKWKIISKLFEGRTDNSIKNHFYSTIRRCLRRINKLQGEKNSTLKMRSIKPYVLSKILADKNLTQTILELGKIKPNKSRRDYKIQYFQEFNQMIEKLYRINSQYQTMKNHKKNNLQGKIKGSSQSENDDSLSGSDIQEDDNDLNSPKKESRKGESSFIKSLRQQKVEEKRQKISPSKLSKNKEIPLKKKNSKGKNEQKVQLKEFKLIKLNEGCERRNRKTINYMKLNEGILCQNERHEGEDTCFDSDLTNKKYIKEDHHMFQEKVFGFQNLDDIMEVQEKQHQKQYLDHVQELDHHYQSVQASYNHRNLLSHQDFQVKGTRHFEIANPSPSYNKSNNNFFDDLVVIGTQLKILATPRAPSAENIGSGSRLDSMQNMQQNFIEQIMQINFDPQFVQRYGSQQKQDCQ